MARTNTLTNFLTDVADSIRSKTGKSELIACEDFDTEIESISGGGSANLQTKSVTITENGTTTITPDTGYDGLEQVNLTTNVKGGVSDRTYLIKDGIVQDTYEYVRTDSTGDYGSFVENYNSEGYAYATSRTWSEYHLNFSSDTSLKAGSRISITFKKDNAWTGSYSQYGGGIIAVMKSGATKYTNNIFINTNAKQEDILTTTITLDANITSFCLIISNLAYTSSYEDYGIKIYDLWTEPPKDAIIFSEWDVNGYPHVAQIQGLTSIPANYLATQGTGDKGMTYMLETISMPDTITTINQSAFYNCKNLNTINIDNVTNIGQSAFYGCSKLLLSTLPNTITTLGANAFQNCSKITIQEIPDTIKTLNNYTFYGCTGIASMNIKSQTMTSIPSSCFYNCTSLETINMPDTITTINQSAFYNCNKLQTVSLPTNITTLGTNAFQNCSALKTISFPANNSNLILNNYCFSGCTSLNIKTIPTAFEIRSRAFSSCTSLKQLSLPNARAFYGSNTNDSCFHTCTSLKAIWIGNATAGSFGRYTFYNCSALIKIYIDSPRATVETFNNYQYAFMNDTTKTGIIICNDDGDWLTQEQFDAIDWENYTEE